MCSTISVTLNNTMSGAARHCALLVRVEPLPGVVSAGGPGAQGGGVLLARRADTLLLLRLRRHAVASRLARSVVHLRRAQCDAEDVLVVPVLILEQYRGDALNTCNGGIQRDRFTYSVIGIVIVS